MEQLLANESETPAIKADYRVIAIDETNHWDKTITDLTGRIAGVYLVNFAEVTHICSFQGSHWAQFIQNITEHYYREPDGYGYGNAIWDQSWLAEADADEIQRSKALADAIGNGPDLKHENAGDIGCYFDEHGLDGLKKSDPIQFSESDEVSDETAMDVVQEYIANGEEWADLAPWRKGVETPVQG